MADPIQFMKIQKRISEQTVTALQAMTVALTGVRDEVAALRAELLTSKSPAPQRADALAVPDGSIPTLAPRGV